MDLRIGGVLACALLLIPGCTVRETDGVVRRGEDVTWEGRILKEGLFVERGARLVLAGSLHTRGPVIVEGDLLAENVVIDFDADARDPRFIVRNGSAVLANTVFRGATVSVAVEGGSLLWTDGELVFSSLTVTSGANATFETARLVNPGGAAELVVAAAGARLVNTSVGETMIVSEAGGSVRLVNVGVTIDQFGGSGLIERAWSVRAHVTSASMAGNPIADLLVRATAPGGDAVTGRTGVDGIAYLEIVELARRNGQLEIHTPHRFTAGSGFTVAPVLGPDQEVRIVHA